MKSAAVRSLKSWIIVLSALSPLSGLSAEPITLFGSLPPSAENPELRSQKFSVAPPVLPDPAFLQRQANEARFAPDQVIKPAKRSAPVGLQYAWKTVFLIYPSIDAVTNSTTGVATRFTYTMSAAEIDEAERAMAAAQTGIYKGSNSEARQEITTVIVGRTLTSLARVGQDLYYWPDAAITGPELQTYCAGGKADSAVVYWPARNRQTSQGVNNPYWGLSYGEIASYSYNVGYSTVCNNVSPEFPGYYPGEVFIHEWLHPTGGYYQKVWGYNIPNLDASGNYSPCPGCSAYTFVYGDGYMPFYRDYMKGTVWNAVQNRYEGMTASAWRSGTPTNTLVLRAAAADWELFQ